MDNNQLSQDFIFTSVFSASLKDAITSREESKFKNIMFTFPRSGVGGFCLFDECLSLFREIGYKLLLITVREETKRKLDSWISF